MSFQAMAWAMDKKVGGPHPKLVLLALANYADEQGMCWPSIALLAAETEMSVRAVKDQLAVLRDKGLVTWEARRRENGSQTSSLYTLALSAAPAPGQSAADDTHPGYASCTPRTSQIDPATMEWSGARSARGPATPNWRAEDRDLFTTLVGAPYIASDGSVWSRGVYETTRVYHALQGRKLDWPGRYLDSLHEGPLAWLTNQGLQPAQEEEPA